MRVLEMIGELKSVAEHAIHAGVSEKNDARQCDRIVVQQVMSPERDHDRKTFVMKDVVGDRTDARIDRISDHPDIRTDEQQQIHPPW